MQLSFLLFFLIISNFKHARVYPGRDLSMHTLSIKGFISQSTHHPTTQSRHHQSQITNSISQSRNHESQEAPSNPGTHQSQTTPLCPNRESQAAPPNAGTMNHSQDLSIQAPRMKASSPNQGITSRMQHHLVKAPSITRSLPKPEPPITGSTS